MKNKKYHSVEKFQNQISKSLRGKIDTPSAISDIIYIHTYKKGLSYNSHN